ncbi:MAG: threonine--tRNA ligase, partial [Betaproteobacteria bacterium]|nr:threonine--tRNA ligase [Betaproteobacteria bacterium]
VKFIDLLKVVYSDFGFEELLVKLSTRPLKRVGTEQQWDKSEAALEAALNQAKLEWELQPEEGAFYGPKIEFSLKDCIGRVWQCGTLQLDFSMPDRLGAEFVAEDNSRQVPVMLHRAILGSMERFIGILIENYAGALPLWLAPEQVVVLNISRGQVDYAREVADKLKENGIRASLDLRNEKITYKIREHSMQKLPYQIIVGDEEVRTSQVAVRNRAGKDLGQMTLHALIDHLKKEISTKH